LTSPNPPKRVQVPAELQRDFTTHWNGFDRAEVRSHLARIEEDMRQMAAERDTAVARATAASKQLDALRGENGKLQARVNELLEPPKNLEDLDRRMQRVGQLAYLRADEVAARAQAASEENWKATAKASIALRERYRSLLKELDTHAEALHAEHRAALEETRAEVKELMVDAVRRRDALDAEAERKRRALEKEFDATMAAQRKELEKHIADQRTAAKQQAERRMAEAQAAARRTVIEANQQAQRRTAEANRVIDRLLVISKDAHGRLDTADKVLAKAEKTLEPTEEEQQPVLRAEDAVPAKEKPGERTKPNSKPAVTPAKPASNGSSSAPDQRKPRPQTASKAR
jgi:colicin import membrane protein